MGKIHLSGLRLLESLSEFVGYKAGVALGREELNKIFQEDTRFEQFANLTDDQHLRIEAVTYEDIVEALLFKMGRLEQPFNHFPSIIMFHKYKGDPKLHEISNHVQEAFLEFINNEGREASQRGDRKLDPTAFMTRCAQEHGTVGLDMAMEVIEATNAYIYKNPWSIPAESQWKDTIELRSLFESENLIAQYGSFFDQRYIDYLNRNLSALDQIHWRKFEQLTAEYFDRNGYRVELGPGRGDDGVDVRAWRTSEADQSRAHIIVQCKRQKAAIEKVIVKAMYADVVHENAESGMIVTTSRLSPGAQLTCTVRNYPVTVSDRETLRKWLEELRHPGTGIVM